MSKLDYTNDYNFKRLSKEGEKSWDDVIKRFINELVKRGAKTSKEDLEWLLLNYYALPNSPALHTAGNKKFYASACSSYPIVDSMDEGEFSILNTLKISSMATKAGIGTGFNFSNLRSKEEPVQGKPGTTGGPVSFLRAYNGFVREISQATRKSAAMGTLSIHHPDIVDFITCKQKDGTIENFNLSVLLSDEFMEAVEKNEQYEIKYPNTKEIKKINAKDIFDLIALNTWNNGEPGLLFTGNIKKDYFADIDDNHILNNPCKPLKSLVLTNKGYRTFGQLLENNDNLNVFFNNKEYKMTKPFLTKKQTEVYRVKLSSGSYLYGTSDHRHKDKNNNWVNLIDMKKGDKLINHFVPLYNFDNIDSDRFDRGFLAGWMYAEGFAYKVDDCNCVVFGGCVGINEFDLIPYLKSIFTEKMFDHMQKPDTCKCFRTGKKEIVSKILDEGYNIDKTDLTWLYLKDRDYKIGFLKAMFTFDGSVRNRNSSVELYSIYRDSLSVIQNILKEFGVYSNLTCHAKAKSYIAKDGKQRNNKETYKIVVPSYMYKKIGFSSNFKQNLLDSIEDKESARVNNKIKYLTVLENPVLDCVEDVYDITVEEIHKFDDSGVVASNCSEALLSYNEGENPWLEMCVLASINLPKFMELKEEHKRQVVYLTVSMLNDIIDVQDYVTPLQKKGMQEINRKIGIGVAGLATILAKQNIKYSSSEAKDLTRNIFKFIGSAARAKSEDMFEKNISKLNDVSSPLHQLKRYNVSLLSVAPTSSISNIFNDMNEEGCSYGIEPYFTLEKYKLKNSFGEYEKKEKIIDFIGEEKAKTIIECANDLDYRAHLNPVEAYYEAHWMRGITQACSKTINFKNNITVDEVKEAIIYCWKNKIKGISFYRDGSRKNQVIQTEESYKTSFLVAYKDGAIEQKDGSKVKVLGKNNTIIEKDVSGLEKGDIILEEETK